MLAGVLQNNRHQQAILPRCEDGGHICPGSLLLTMACIEKVHPAGTKAKQNASLDPVGPCTAEMHLTIDNIR